MIQLDIDWIDRQIETLRHQQRQVEAQHHRLGGAIELLEKQRLLLQNGHTPGAAEDGNEEEE